jgi:hypothetical protein
MRYWMVRTFDHSGYYETRLLLALVATGVALYFVITRRDYRFAVILVSGVFFQALLEYRLQAGGLRGAAYELSIFGLRLRGWPAFTFQGCAEGGILALMSLWFVDIAARGGAGAARNGYLAACALIVALALVVGILSRGAAITSVRPMFGRGVANLALIVGISVLLCALTGGLRWLALYFAGCLIYVVLTFEPLQLTRARYIALRDSAGGYVAAPLAAQVAVMLYSNLFEVAGGKLHYFAVPFALRLLKFSAPE